MVLTTRGFLGALAFALLICLAPSISSAAQVTVSMNGTNFVPAHITINSGDTVVWTNTDSMPHTVTATNNSFDSGIMQPGAIYSQTFTIPGTYNYSCLLHPGMVGTITVVGAASTPTGSNSQADALRAQAQELLNRIAALQQQIGVNTSTTNTTATNVTIDSSSCPLIGRSLRRGASGDDVTRLQYFLARDTAVYPEAQVTGYYGALTEAAVKRWQVKFNIVSSGTADTTGYGVVGPRTAAAIALVCSTMSGGGGGGPSAPTGAVGGFIQVTPVTGVTPLSVSVIATVNTTNSCTGAVYALDYGDGTIPSQIVVPAGNCQQMVQNLGHVYTFGGTYIITLSSGPHRTSATVVAQGPGPATPGQPAQADSVSASPTSGNAPLTVTFTGTINGAQSCAGGTYTLQFGDDLSVPLTFEASSCAPRAFSVTHQYIAGGTFDVRLYKGSGSSATPVGSAVRITVSGQTSGFGPMSVLPNVGGNPYAVTAEFELPTSCFGYTLSWGDSTPAVSGGGSGCPAASPTTKTVNHTYSGPGTYTITLTRASQVDTALISIQ